VSIVEFRASKHGARPTGLWKKHKHDQKGNARPLYDDHAALMFSLVEFLHCKDLVDWDMFAGHMCETAGGGVSSCATAMLMGVCKEARHLLVVLLLLQLLTTRAHGPSPSAPGAC